MHFNDKLHFEHHHTNLDTSSVFFSLLDTVKQLDQFMKQRSDVGDNPAPVKPKYVMSCICEGGPCFNTKKWILSCRRLRTLDFI